ncbi:MAG: MBL fold metallo-hydrolase [candidate division WOR-3 bacterium]
MRDLTFTSERVGGVEIIGGPYAFVYLVGGKLLIDTGTAYWGKRITEFLRERGIGISLLFFTHSHYDHIGGAPYVITEFSPQVFAHPYFHRVFSSERAIKLINELNLREGEMVGFKDKNYEFKPFEFLPLDDGQTLELKDHRITAYYTPGHTRDTITFVIEPEMIAVMGEAVGVPNHNNTFILPQFLTGLGDYIKGIQFITSLDIEVLGLPHEMVIRGKVNVKNYLKNSYETTLWYAEYLKGLIKEYGDHWEGIKNRVIEDIYKKHSLRQPMHAFLANLQAQINVIKGEFNL